MGVKARLYGSDMSYVVLVEAQLVTYSTEPMGILTDPTSAVIRLWICPCTFPYINTGEVQSYVAAKDWIRSASEQSPNLILNMQLVWDILLNVVDNEYLWLFSLHI